jgi:hypothetical protein
MLDKYKIIERVMSVIGICGNILVYVILLFMSLGIWYFVIDFIMYSN